MRKRIPPSSVPKMQKRSSKSQPMSDESFNRVEPGKTAGRQRSSFTKLNGRVSRQPESRLREVGNAILEAFRADWAVKPAPYLRQRLSCRSPRAHDCN